MATARVFKSGNSQAVRLPKAFRLKSKEVEIFRRDDEIVLREKKKGRGMTEFLDALRSIIYSDVQPHPSTPALMAGDTRFERAASNRVRYSVVVDSAAQIMNLLAMTPYYWNISVETKAAVEALSRLEVTVDAYVNVFRPR